MLSEDEPIPGSPGAHVSMLLVAAMLLLASRVAAAPCVIDNDCADGDLCNGIERCVAGACVTGVPLACDDADTCTRDFCDPGAGCAHAEDQCPASCVGRPDAARCADGTVCTRGDACAGEACVPGAAAACADGDPCTLDVCDPVLGCVYAEEATGFPCVPDCNGGVADYTACPGDDNVCTLDACLPSVDLIGNPHMCVIGLLGFRQCDDNDVCDGVEFCSPVLGCEEGPPLACDDGNACNGIEACDPVGACQPGTPLVDGTACDDGRECTTADACAAGACVGAPLPPATCDDGDPLTSDVCEDGFGCLHCAASTLGRLGVRLGAPGAQALKGRGILPPGSAAALAPAASAAAVLVSDGAASVYRVELAAGALLPKRGGASFGYRDRHGALAGLRSLRLQARQGTFKWSMAAHDLTLPAVPATATVRLVLGAACFQASAPCSGSPASLVCR